MKKITEEWLKAAHADIMVIEKIIDSEYLTHIVAFHAQQLRFAPTSFLSNTAQQTQATQQTRWPPSSPSW